MSLSPQDIYPDIQRAVRIALEEDIGSGDITAELIPADRRAEARVITRENCVLCGQAWFDETFRQLGGVEQIEWQIEEGADAEAGSELVRLQGNCRSLLTGERTALNFLQLLSGTATTSREYAKLVEGSGVKILDTRKTIPGLRTAQKYAVGVGGCFNHRMGLWDAFLIKENHIAACGGITAAVARARELYPDRKLEVEVENVVELEEAVGCGVDVVMLDNIPSLDTIANLKNTAYKNLPKLEFSGNVDFDKLESGLVDFNLADHVSCGSLTKNILAIDLSFLIM